MQSQSHVHSMSRRQCLRSLSLTAASLIGAPLLSLAAEEKKTAESFPPIRAITKGPRFHWFGYYDKLQFDPSSRYVLGNQINFEHRSPRPEDVLHLGMIDLKENDRWIDLGKSSAWGWQQGCMLQWMPGSKTDVIWNDRDGDQFVCHILNVETKEKKTFPFSIYSIHPNGQGAVTTDFGRLVTERPGYGYAGVPDKFANEDAPRESGIWHVDFKTNERKLIYSLADAAELNATPEIKTAKHRFEHLLYNTDGSRIVFLDRYTFKTDRPGSFRTRMITISPEGKDPFVIDQAAATSHFIWRDPTHILAWRQPKNQLAGFYLFEDKTSNSELVGKGVMTENGHVTYLPGNKWLLNDTYPDKERKQHPFLYHIASGKRVPLGDFTSPSEYKGEWRCDTHPRFSPDGKSVVIDSPHGGDGRQMYLIDVSKIVQE